MVNYNQTSTDFFLLGLLPPSKIGLFFFSLIMLMFLMVLLGNLSMVLLIVLDTRLYTPMYVLLSQLSHIDLNYISTTIPKMAFNYLLGNKSTLFIGCGVQNFFFMTLVGTEGLLLTCMAYERYVAICFPLYYPTQMSKRVCVLMIAGSWITDASNSSAHTAYILHIPYCRFRTINHFFCDIPAMMTLACMDIWFYECTVFVNTIFFLLLPFMAIAYSYSQVLSACVQWQGGRRVYWTCSTHLTMVTLFYAPFVYNYLCPRSLRSPTEDVILTVFYTILIPVLNPVIYSLRNKEVMGSLRRVIQRIHFVKM